MRFLLFVFLNAVLFLRPGDLVPAIAAWPIYLALLGVCWLVSLPALTEPGKLWGLFSHPVTLCVLGLEVSIGLSHLSHGRFYEARTSVLEFGKVVLYYLLLVSVLDTRERLQSFLVWLVIFATGLTGVAVLQYYDLVSLPSFSAVLEQRSYNLENGEVEIIPRLRSLGLFNDPNDLCLLLVLGTGICFYRLAGAGQQRSNGLFALPLIPFGVALILTQSRGGLIAMLAGVMTFVGFRWNWRRAVLLAGIGLPPLLLLIGGRMARLSAGEDTAQDRLSLWSEALQMIRHSPLFGIGYDKFAEEVGLVAHNSFVQCFAELGLLGGIFFVGCFYAAVRSVARIAPERSDEDPELDRLRPYLVAMTVAYAVGLLALTRCYIAPTYMVLGLNVAFSRVAHPAPLPSLAADYGRLARGIVLVSGGFLALVYAFVRVAGTQVS